MGMISDYGQRIVRLEERKQSRHFAIHRRACLSGGLFFFGDLETSPLLKSQIRRPGLLRVPRLPAFYGFPL
jgi:hypothetical protein